MEENKEKLIIDFGKVEYSPAIIDYDFINNRPRGGSSRIDFFSHGAVSSSLEGLEFDTKIYLKKDNIFFEKGVFLLDFQEVQRNHHIFLDMVNNLKLERIYLENSIHFNIASIGSEQDHVIGAEGPGQDIHPKGILNSQLLIQQKGGNQTTADKHGNHKEHVKDAVALQLCFGHHVAR